MSTQASNKLWWLVFVLGIIAFVFLAIFFNKWFWPTLPFIFTGLVKGMNWI